MFELLYLEYNFSMIIMKEYKELKVISVGNGSKQYPGNFTLKEIKIIDIFLQSEKTLNLFSGKSKFGFNRVDKIKNIE